MPSAARHFTREVVRDLHRRGVEIVAVTLHTGVSSLESHEPPMTERFEVNASPAAIVDRARRRGGADHRRWNHLRAIESAVRDGSIVPSRGWTDLVISPERRTVVVAGS